MSAGGVRPARPSFRPPSAMAAPRGCVENRPAPVGVPSACPRSPASGVDVIYNTAVQSRLGDTMADLPRRRVLKAGAAGAGALLLPVPWTAAARAGSAARSARRQRPRPVVRRVRRHGLAARAADRQRAPRRHGVRQRRRGRLQLNEDTIWAGGPYDQSNTRGAGALAQIRQLVFADQWSQAQSLIDQNMLGIPGRSWRTRSWATCG